jgi:chromosome segregation ATPase
MDLKSIADRLYGLRPTEFMAARTEYVREAKEAGDKEVAAGIAKLRKPSQAAWILNLLARREPAELQRLGNLGAALRDAHGRVDGESIRDLSKQRHQVIRALVAQVRSMAKQEGQKLSESVLRDVEAVFSKALADPAVTETLQAGTLAATTDLTEQEGWPEAPEPVVDEVAQRREQRAERRRQELGRAKAEAQHTSEVRDRAQNALAHAEQKAERAARSVQELEGELERARTTEEEANSEVRDARAVFRTAEKAAERARRQLESLDS